MDIYDNYVQTGYPKFLINHKDKIENKKENPLEKSLVLKFKNQEDGPSSSLIHRSRPNKAFSCTQ